MPSFEWPFPLLVEISGEHHRLDLIALTLAQPLQDLPLRTPPSIYAFTSLYNKKTKFVVTPANL